MMAFAQHVFHFFGTHVVTTRHCQEFTHKFFVAFKLFGVFYLLWLNQMFSQPQTVAQTQSAQHAKDTLQ